MASATPSPKRLVGTVVRYYLRYDSENPFIFVSGLLAFLGIAAGVMVLMIAMGIMNGTQKEFRKRLFVMNYPLTLVSYANQGVPASLLTTLHRRFPTLGISPYYTTQVIAKNANGVQGGILYGVDFAKEASINPVFAKAVRSLRDPGRFPLVVGDDLATMLGVDRGERLLLYFSQQQAVGLASLPLQKRFRIAGIFDSGLSAYDKAIMYSSLEAMRKVLKKDPASFDGAHLFTDRPMELIDRIRPLLPDNVDIEGWWQQNGNFFSAMEMEKKALFLVLLLIILVASLNIISSLLMTVMSRRSEIALLRTLGATRREIRSIFFRLGVIIGGAGILAGTLLGLLGSWVLKNFDIVTLPADVYGTSRLPVDLTLGDYGWILAGTTLIVILSALYPARKAADTDPLTVLRNE